MHRQTGQATVEWVALLLLAALILGAAAVHSSRDRDRGVGELVANRIASAPRELSIEPDTAASPGGRAPAAGIERGAPPGTRRGGSAPAASGPPSHTPSGSVQRGLRGVTRVAERAWIVCLGYRRLRHELEHPLAPNEALPLGDALDIANSCLNPLAFLFED